MLRHLHIENYTIIESLDLEFGPGLNVLTGETGSGKSIVVDAVELLLGGKASTDLIRSGSERAQISGVFSAGPSSIKASTAQWRRLRALLQESGVELEEGDDLIVQRDITAGGKSRVFVNHLPATAGLLKTLAPHLAEVHGQNEQQEIFSAAAQLEMLDRFGGLTPVASELRERFGEWRALRERKENLALRQRERLRQMDLWLFQKREIEQAALIAGEDQELEKEKLMLAHATRIHASLASAFDLLYDASGSATAAIASACRRLEEVTAFDASLAPLVENLRSAQSTADDVALTLRDRLSSLDVSPRRLEEVEDRLALLDRLKRKYGNTLDEVIAYFEQISADVREAESTEALGEELEKKLAACAAGYKKAPRSYPPNGARHPRI